MTEWQPIKTAPTEHGSRADLYVPPDDNPEHVPTGRLTGCFYSTAYDPPTWGKTYFGSGGEHFVKITRASHWMPIPDPP